MFFTKIQNHIEELNSFGSKIVIFCQRSLCQVKDSLYHINPYCADESPDVRVKKALVVDDESDICYLLGNILKQANIQPVLAGSIAEAEEMLQSDNPFYYVFLDNYLPDGLGINQVRKWKVRYPHLNLIMMTAHDSYEERNKARMDGADYFISKPFSRELILNTVVATLG